MKKQIIFFLVFTGLSFGQTKLEHFIHDSWNMTGQVLKESLKGKQYQEKKIMSFSGITVTDTLAGEAASVAYLFNAEGKQITRGISNKDKSAAASKKMLDLLTKYLNKSCGPSSSDHEMFGVRVMKWKNKRFEYTVNYGSGTCMLTVTK